MVTDVFTAEEFISAVESHRQFIRLRSNLDFSAFANRFVASDEPGVFAVLRGYSGYIDGGYYKISLSQSFGTQSDVLFVNFSGTIHRVVFNIEGQGGLAWQCEQAVIEDVVFEDCRDSLVEHHLYAGNPPRSSCIGGRITMLNCVVGGTHEGLLNIITRNSNNNNIYFSDVAILNYSREFIESNIPIGGLIGRLYISPTAYSESDDDAIPAGNEPGDVIPIANSKFNALSTSLIPVDGSEPAASTPAAAIPESWDDFIWSNAPETLRRAVNWITPVGNNVPPGAIYGIRMYRNQGAGWQLLARNTEADSYPADGLMSTTEDGYEFIDSFSIAQSPITNHGRAADFAISNDLLDVPPPNAVAVARHANGFYLLAAGRQFMPSLPGNPVAFPIAYRRELPEPIIDVIEYSDRFLVFTKSRVYRVDGFSPAGLTISELELTYEPQGAAARVGQMVYYSVREGISAVGDDSVLATSSMLSARNFEPYADGNAFAAVADGRYYIFPGGPGGGDALCFSSRENNSLFYARFFDDVVDANDFLQDERDGMRRLEITAAASHPDGGMVIAGNLVRSGSSFLRRWRPLVGAVQCAKWRSKTYRYERPVDFRAAKVRFLNDDVSSVASVGGVRPDERPDSISGGVIGSARAGFADDDYSLSIGGIGFTGRNIVDEVAILNIYANGACTFFERADRFGSYAFDMAASGAHTDWQIELVTNKIVTGVAIALSKTQIGRSPI